MAHDEDMILVQRAKEESDSESFQKICDKYENIYYKVCQKYTPSLLASGISPQDIYDEKNIVIWNCIKSFAPEKSKLGTWIGNYARYLCLNSINSKKFVVSIEDTELNEKAENLQYRDQYYPSQPDIAEQIEHFDYLLEHIEDKRIAEIFKIRYSDRKKVPWTIIASRMDLSVQTVINLHRKGLEFLRKRMDQNNFHLTF